MGPMDDAGTVQATSWDSPLSELELKAVPVVTEKKVKRVVTEAQDSADCDRTCVMQLKRAREAYSSNPDEAQRLLEEISSAEVLLALGTEPAGSNASAAQPHHEHLHPHQPQPVSPTQPAAMVAALGKPFPSKPPSGGKPGSGGRPRAFSKLREWQLTLYEILTQPNLELDRQQAKLQHAVKQAQQQGMTRGTLIPQQLEGILAKAKSTRGMIADIQNFLHLWTRPRFSTCESCGKQRLVKHLGPPRDAFFCGHATALLPERSCRTNRADEELDWEALFPQSLLAFAVESTGVERGDAEALDNTPMPSARTADAHGIPGQSMQPKRGEGHQAKVPRLMTAEEAAAPATFLQGATLTYDGQQVQLNQAMMVQLQQLLQQQPQMLGQQSLGSLLSNHSQQPTQPEQTPYTAQEDQQQQQQQALDLLQHHSRQAQARQQQTQQYQDPSQARIQQLAGPDSHDAYAQAPSSQQQQQQQARLGGRGGRQRSSPNSDEATEEYNEVAGGQAAGQMMFLKQGNMLVQAGQPRLSANGNSTASGASDDDKLYTVEVQQPGSAQTQLMVMKMGSNGQLQPVDTGQPAMQQLQRVKAKQQMALVNKAGSGVAPAAVTAANQAGMPMQVIDPTTGKKMTLMVAPMGPGQAAGPASALRPSTDAHMGGQGSQTVLLQTATGTVQAVPISSLGSLTTAQQHLGQTNRPALNQNAPAANNQALRYLVPLNKQQQQQPRAGGAGGQVKLVPFNPNAPHGQLSKAAPPGITYMKLPDGTTAAVQPLGTQQQLQHHQQQQQSQQPQYILLPSGQTAMITQPAQQHPQRPPAPVQTLNIGGVTYVVQQQEPDVQQQLQVAQAQAAARAQAARQQPHLIMTQQGPMQVVQPSTGHQVQFNASGFRYAPEALGTGDRQRVVKLRQADNGQYIPYEEPASPNAARLPQHLSHAAAPPAANQAPQTMAIQGPDGTVRYVQVVQQQAPAQPQYMQQIMGYMQGTNNKQLLLPLGGNGEVDSTALASLLSSIGAMHRSNGEAGTAAPGPQLVQRNARPAQAQGTPAAGDVMDAALDQRMGVEHVHEHREKKQRGLLNSDSTEEMSADPQQAYLLDVYEGNASAEIPVSKLPPPQYGQRPSFLNPTNNRASPDAMTVAWTARVITRANAGDEMELYCVSADVPEALAQALPPVMVVSDFKLRKDIAVGNMKGKPMLMWLSPDTKVHQQSALSKLAQVKVGAVIHLDDQHDFVMSPQEIQDNIVLVGVLLTRHVEEHPNDVHTQELVDVQTY